MEAMMTIAILGIVVAGIGQILKNGLYQWRVGSARMALHTEARTAMDALTKFVHNAQGASISISRLNSSQPAYSYISAKLAETAFIATNSPGGCSFTTGMTTLGSSGAEVEIYQDGRYLVARSFTRPAAPAYSSPSSIQFTYSYVTLSANLESLMIVYDSALEDSTIHIGARFKRYINDMIPPATMFLKKSLVIKRHHAAGYYADR